MDRAFVFVAVSFIFLIVLFITLPCTAAEDAQWKIFDSCVDLADYYYDTTSVSAVDNVMIRVRTRFHFTDEEFPLAESRLLFEFNCSDKTYRVLETTDIHRNGTTEQKGPTKKRPVPPTSVYENLYMRVCK